LLLNEIDYEEDHTALLGLKDNYLAVDMGESKGCRYEYFFAGAVNTGVASGYDLDGNGKSTDPADCFGFGHYPGQYGMAVLSRFPINKRGIRTFQNFRWIDMPDAALPKDPKSGDPFYSAEVAQELRLSSKSHWDVPIECQGITIHLLVCHPTPPVSKSR
jgi:hypothetical protein